MVEFEELFPSMAGITVARLVWLVKRYRPIGAHLGEFLGYEAKKFQTLATRADFLNTLLPVL
jgi:hypothetical protein